jgi:hypothetical protein
MQQPLAAQQILGKTFGCLNRKKQMDFAVFSCYFTNFQPVLSGLMAQSAM